MICILRKLVACVPIVVLSFLSLMMVQPAFANGWYVDRPSADISCSNPPSGVCPWQFNYRTQDLQGPQVTSAVQPFSDSALALSMETYQYSQNIDGSGRDAYTLILMASANSRLAHQYSSPSYRNEWDLNQCPASCTDLGLGTINQAVWKWLGFTFYLYGNPYNMVFICSNGYVAFVYNQAATTCPASPTAFPAQATASDGTILSIPNSVISPWWRPQDVSRYAGTSAQGHVYINTNVLNDPTPCISCPLKSFGIDWVHMPIQGGGCHLDHCSPYCFPCYSSYGITIDEAGGIYFEYGAMDNSLLPSQSGATNGAMGVEDPSGTLATTADPDTAVSNGGFTIRDANYPPPVISGITGTFAWLNDLKLTFDDLSPGDGATLAGISGDLYGRGIVSSPQNYCSSTPPTIGIPSCQGTAKIVEAGAILLLCAAFSEGCFAINIADIGFNYLADAFPSASFQQTTMDGTSATSPKQGVLETPVVDQSGLCSTCAYKYSGTDAAIFYVVQWVVPHIGTTTHKVAIKFGAEMGPPSGGVSFSDSSHTRGWAEVDLSVDAGDFTISNNGASPSAIFPGSSLTSTISLQMNSFAGYGEPMSLSTSVSPNNGPGLTPTASIASSVNLSPGGSASTLLTVSTPPSTFPSFPNGYSVTVTATDPYGTLTHSTTIPFTVMFPLSFSTNPANPSPGQPVTFTASASGGTSPYTFNWNFGDGGTATGSPASHTYSTSGNYVVDLSSTDAVGRTSQVSAAVTVQTLGTSLSNNPASSDWTVLKGTWAVKNGVIDATPSSSTTDPIMMSTSTFASNRTVTVRAITITAGSSAYNTAWIGGKYVDSSNSIILILHTDGKVELQFKQNGVQSSYTTGTTGLNPFVWHTFQMVFSGNTVNAYLDGTLYLTVTNSLVGSLGAAHISLESHGAPESQFDSATIS
ncbi:PKD domain-containing protein [Candidatus Bathyarchaeota archaeon]|nr:MAG: PKD domain-containing protein [Candidatus Bathyarchaeota archaeon]